MIIKINRLYKGWASIRSYSVERAIANNTSLTIKLGKKTMTVSPNQMKIAYKNRSKRQFRSKINGGYYTLVDFIWKKD